MNTTVTATHLLWAGRWFEVKKSRDGWIFKNGYDAAEWLLWRG